MPKKLVAGLIGWLILALFLTSSVWAAANKDKKPVVKKQIEAPTITSSSLGKSMEETIKERFFSDQMLPYDKMLRALEAAKSSETRYVGSVYEAAAGVISESPFFSPGVLTETAPENYDTAGNTYYGINSNHRNPRQIAMPRTNTNVGMAWTKDVNIAITARNVMGTLWKNSSKFGGNYLTDISLNGDLLGRTGFCGMTYTPKTGRFVIYGHHANTTAGPTGTYFGVETAAGQFDWGSDVHAPDSVAGNAFPGQWPTAAGGVRPDVGDVDGDLNTAESLEVIHFFMNEGNTAGGSVDDYGYSRAIDSAGVWIFKGFTGRISFVVDSGVGISPTVVASKKSARVALIYTSPKRCGYSPTNCNDLYYKESMNGGNDWAAAGFNFSGFPSTKITTYDSSSTVTATSDFMGVYDENDSLVISYNQLVTYAIAGGTESYDADIMVWTKQWGSRKAVDGFFSTTGARMPQSGFRKSLNFPMIGVHDGTGTIGRKNYLYLTYTQFSGLDAASKADTNVEGYYNGEIYIKASTNGGKTWGPGINATNSKTPACDNVTGSPQHGDCSATIYSSCAERVNDTIQIAYLSDEYAGVWTNGSDDNTSATATFNPMIYMKYPAFTPTPVQQISVTPTSFIQNPKFPSSLTDTFFVQNIGNASLTVDSIRHKTSATWLTINNGTGGFTILEGNPDVAIGFRVTDSTLADNVYYDTIRVYNQSTNKPLVEIPVFMIVDNGIAFISTQWKVMNNGAVNIIVGNMSNVANQNDTGGFYRKVGSGTKIDTTSNLFDASKFIAVKDSSGELIEARYLFNQTYMQPLDTLYCVDSNVTSPILKPGSKVKIPVGNYKYCRTSYTMFYPGANGVEWPGPWSNLKVTEEWWLPKTPSPVWDPKFLLWCQTIQSGITAPSWWTTPRLFNPANETLYIGKALDWDVFTARGSENFGWADRSLGFVWQEGKKDTFPQAKDPNGHFGFTAYLDTASTPGAFAAHVVSNPSYIYPSSGYDDVQLYAIAKDVSQDPALDTVFTEGSFKYVPKDSLAKDTIPVDLNSVLTDIRITPPYPASITVYNVLGVIGDTVEDPNKGCDSLGKAYFNMRAALGLGNFAPTADSLAKILNCKLSNCIAKPGDANASGTYTLGDVISIVNYIFNKDGCTPKPLCWLSSLLCRGDWNGSGTVSLSDVIQAVNFIFNKPNGPWNALPSGVCCL